MGFPKLLVTVTEQCPIGLCGLYHSKPAVEFRDQFCVAPPHCGIQLPVDKLAGWSLKSGKHFILLVFKAAVTASVTILPVKSAMSFKVSRKNAAICFCSGAAEVDPLSGVAELVDSSGCSSWVAELSDFSGCSLAELEYFSGCSSAMLSPPPISAVSPAGSRWLAFLDLVIMVSPSIFNQSVDSYHRTNVEETVDPTAATKNDVTVTCRGCRLQRRCELSNSSLTQHSLHSTHTDMNYRLTEYNTFIQVNHHGTFITQFTSKALL